MGIFYVIEKSKGNGPEGEYLTSRTNSKGSHDNYFITDDVNYCARFPTRDLAQIVFDIIGFTQKDWQITEHCFQ